MSEENGKNPRIGIMAAMDSEFSRLESIFKDDPNVRIEKTGIGKVNAALGTQRLIDAFKPDIIISSGCAGGCHSSLNVTDTVVSEYVRYHDVYCGSENEYGQVQGMPARYASDKELVEAALSLDGETHILAGTIASGDWFVTSPDKMRDILSKVPEAVAVDMESGAIAQTCHINGVRFIAFRVISDIPLKENNTEQYENFWTTLADNSFNITARFVEKIKNN